MGLLNKKWHERSIEEHKRILFSAPYDDRAGIRASLFGKLRLQGYSEAEIKKMVYEQYPETKKEHVFYYLVLSVQLEVVY